MAETVETAEVAETVCEGASQGQLNDVPFRVWMSGDLSAFTSLVCRGDRATGQWRNVYDRSARCVNVPRLSGLSKQDGFRFARQTASDARCVRRLGVAANSGEIFPDL